ncbi:MAG: LssY C-terminal domain-containing protein [Propionicimonas sp.]
MTAPAQGGETGFLARLDTVFFVVGGLAAAWLAYLVLVEGIRPGWPSLLLVVFWFLVAYLALPRLHRILTRIYLPDYFIGRTRTSDGLLGDPVNLALRGTGEDLHQAMVRAGWTRADDLSFATGWRIVTSTLTRRSYPTAPVSPLHLFGRQQDFAYQQEMAGNPAKRHHVRFWECPKEWLLPGGFDVDWLAAGTFDRSVGLSLFTLQVTHKIDQNTDAERDHIAKTLTDADPATTVEVIENFSAGYHSRNGGGDLIETDGHLPVVNLPATVRSPGTLQLPPSPATALPAQTVFGGAVAVVRGVTYLALAALLAISAGPGVAQGPATDILTDQVSATAFLVAGLMDLVLAGAVLRGRNWARILLSAASCVGVVLAFLAYVAGGLVITLRTELVPVAISVLVLLALSSESARRYALTRRLPGH